MVTSNIIPKSKNSGFTIVELLIVIVVIGILAAITIVAYSGITNRANSSKALTNAANAQKVGEAISADNGTYPITAAAFATGSSSTRLPSGLTVVPETGTFASPTWVGTGSANSATDGLTRVAYSCLSTVVNVGPCLGTGGRIAYWDYSGTPQVRYLYIGSASGTSTTFFFPGT